MIVTDVWDPQVNGVATALKKIKEILEKKGMSVVIVHPGLFQTLPLFFYPEIRLSLFSRRRIGEIIQTEQPNYIHIATEGPLGFSARRICAKKNLLFTTAYHTHFPLYAKSYFGLFSNTVYSYLRWFHRPAVSTLVSTKSLKDELESNGFQHLVVSPLGVDSSLFKRNPTPDLPSLPKPVFVYFGRIAKEKNVEDFLRCELPGTKLVIGDGPDRVALEKKYSASNLFVGYKKGQVLVDWLSLCDVFVFPSRTETFGLVVLEALSCGIPVTAYDVMGPKDIITSGADGYLVSNLAAGARQCLRLSSVSCRGKALRYSWESSTDIFLKNQARTS